jgi:hypothetical protein
MIVSTREPIHYVARRGREQGEIGSTKWSYFVAHSNDIELALKRLQWAVFARSDFFVSPKNKGKTFASTWDLCNAQDEGTHSILDVTRVIVGGEFLCFGRYSGLAPPKAYLIISDEMKV